jgi:plastocyanin
VLASAGPTKAIPGAAEVIVGPDGSDTYDPSTVWLRMGGATTWTWASDGHTVTDSSPLGLFDSGVRNSEAIFTYTSVAVHLYESTH